MLPLVRPHSRNLFLLACLAASSVCAGHLRGEVIINEIHFAPDVKTERVEFVELYNTGSVDVDVGGWTLSDGVEYRLPTGTRIAANNYLVIAEDPSAVQVKLGVANSLGPWVGRLSNEGDRIVLRDAAAQVVDEVEYQLGFPWPTVGDPPGYSIELVNPNLDNNVGGSWRGSVAGGAVVQTKTLVPERGTWRYIKGTGEASSPATAWRERGFDDSIWLQGVTPIGYGEPFVATVLDDMRFNYGSVFARQTFTIDDPATISDLVLEAQYDDGLKVWINGVNVLNANLPPGEVPFNSTASSAIENGDFVPFPLGSAAQHLVSGVNVLAVQAHNSSVVASTDFFFDIRLVSQTGPSGRGPTPGRQNAVFSDKAPPQIRQVTHVPEQPASGQTVRITARITDADGVGEVSLQYQVVDPGNYIELSDAAYQQGWTSLPMNDVGAGADAIAHDGDYSVDIPASVQLHRRLVRYRITAADGGGRALTVPYPDDPQPNFAYFVYDGVPSWSGAIEPGSADSARGTPVTYGTNVMRSLPVYHLLSKKDSVEEATWFSSYGGDLYRWKGALVYDGKVYDHIGYRARGGVWRYAMGKNMWKFDFNRGHDFEPRDDRGRVYAAGWTKLNLGACIQQGDYQHRGEQGLFESVGFRLFNLAGVEAPKTHFVHLRIVDETQETIPADQFSGDFWGLYLAVEQEDGRFLDEHGLPDGNFYKMEGGSGELNNQGTFGATDKSDLNEFMETYRNQATPDDWWRQNFSLDHYYSYQAIVQGIHHYDICYGKNYFYFLDPDTQVWSVHPWDLDLTWANNMFDAGCGGTDEFKDRLLPRPAFQLAFQNRVREIRDLLFNTDQAWRLIDEYAFLIDDPNGGPSFVDADRAMWDFNPVMADRNIINRSKAGQGRFYQVVPTKDFPGMVAKMKDYVVERGAFLSSLADDPLIPDVPVINPVSLATIPANRLSFRAAPYSGPNPFSAMKWRIGEITASNSPSFNPAAARRYEIEPVWESPEFAALTADITVPAGTVKVGHTYRLRLRMMDTTGRWSHWSQPVEFTAAQPDASDALEDNLRVTEILFNPPAGSDLEFIELHNASDVLTLDLSGVTFSQGVDYTFPAGITLPPLGYLLVTPAASTADFANFRAFYGLSSDVPVFGSYSGALNNAGEEITLRTAAGGSEIVSFEFGDGRGWPVAADGTGHSLVPAGGGDNVNGRLNYPGNWRASSFLNGSPGRADPLPPAGLVLNEIVAHTDLAGEFDSNDGIELYNPTDSAINLGPNWFLSDDTAELKKWEIPSNTVVPAHGWVVFDEVTGFHNPPSAGFGLSKNGEQVLLSHLPGTSADRVADSVSFKAQENDWSLGRYPDGGAWWSALTPRTLGSANRQSPARVMITEIMFHPEPTASSPEDNTADEYVEIYNPASAPVSLSNTNGVWRLDGGLELLLPPATVLPAGGVLLAVSFNPTDSLALDAFRLAYGLTNSSLLLAGPYLGRLNNSSDRVAVELPQYADLTNSPPVWVVVDEAIYSDQAPWPDAADGSGLALHRISPAVSANDPANWRAAAPSPGRVDALPSDADADGLPDDWERAHGLDPAFVGDAIADPDGDGFDNRSEYQARTDPQDPASVLRLTGALSEQGGATLSFTAVEGTAYRLAYRDSLSDGAWQIFQEIPASPTTGRIEMIDSSPNPAGQRYYQVQVQTSP